MELLFLGTTPCIHDRDDDAPAFLINKEVLVDCGWNAIDTLVSLGEKPENLRALLFTHMHHDHYLGLPALLFYIVQTGIFPLSSFVIAGPEEDLERVVGYAMTFLQIDTFYPGTKGPKLVPLKPGDTFDTETLSVRVGESRHPVPALAYRFTDKNDGAVLGIAGDTVVHPGSEPFFSGKAFAAEGDPVPCDVLVHDSAYGWYNAEPPALRRYGHSTVPEAAELAEACGIPAVYPMHLTIPKAEAFAKQYRDEHPDSPVSVIPARKGDRVTIVHRKNG